MDEDAMAYKMTEEGQAKEIEWLRSRARHEEAQALHDNSARIARNMLTGGEPIEKIIKCTDLTREEVEELRQ
jgi:hypothetical protein